MNYDYRFGRSEGKADVINEIVAICNDLEKNETTTVFDFGKDGNLVLHICKDGDFRRESDEWNLVRISTAFDGKFVDDTEDTHVTDGSLFRELDRIWEHGDFATL